MASKLQFGLFHEFKGGPTILFFGSASALQSLNDALSALSDQRELSLEKDSRFLPLGGIEVLLALSHHTRGRGMRCIERDKSSFKWDLSIEDIREITELTTPVIQSAHACHQYLDRALAQDDVQVMVSKDEYPDTLRP